MSDDPSEPPTPDPEGKKPPDLPVLFPKFDLSMMLPKFDLSMMLPKFDASMMLPKFDPSMMLPKFDPSMMLPKFDLSAVFPKPIDVSLFSPKIDVSAFIPLADLSALFTGLNSALLFPTLDASVLFPTLDFQSLLAQVGAFTLPRVVDQDGSVEVDAENQSTVPSLQAAAIVTAFVFFIVFIGLALMVQDLPQIAKISQLTGANPFDIAMGFGALAFWVAYSRRRS
jgi:hypothetical protein